MEEGRRYFRLGLFVLVSVSLLVAVLFMLGGRKLFQPTFTFETYFNESVAGLEVGAPVRFRGVPLGRVSEILTSRSTYERGVPLDKRRGYIVVRAKVDLSADEAEEMEGDAVQLVKRGLRAQTQLAGVTGQQYLAVDFLDPAKYPPLEFDWTPKYAYLPSAPSLSGVIIANAQTFLASLNAANVRALSQNLSTLVVDLDKKLNEVPVSELSADAHDVLARIDAVLADPALEKTLHDVAAISGHVRKLADDGNLDRMVERIDGAADRLDALIGENQYDVRVVVQDLRVTADNLRVLSETLKRYPAGALVGGPPAQVQPPGTAR